MKSQKLLLSATLILSIVFSASAGEVITTPSKPTSIEGSSSRTQEMMTRLSEIRGMNVKELTKAERKSLRKETRSMEKELKQTRNASSNGGVYISVGGLLLLILILIIIL